MTILERISCALIAAGVIATSAFAETSYVRAGRMIDYVVNLRR